MREFIELNGKDLEEHCFDCGSFFVGIPPLCENLDCPIIEQINRRPVIRENDRKELAEVGFIAIDPPVFGEGKYLVYYEDLKFLEE